MPAEKWRFCARVSRVCVCYQYQRLWEHILIWKGQMNIFKIFIELWSSNQQPCYVSKMESHHVKGKYMSGFIKPDTQ